MYDSAPSSDAEAVKAALCAIRDLMRRKGAAKLIQSLENNVGDAPSTPSVPGMNSPDNESDSKTPKSVSLIASLASKPKSSSVHPKSDASAY